MWRLAVAEPRVAVAVPRPAARVLVTGVAGFIGMHLARRLLSDGVQVWGIDTLDDYYDPQLKRARLAQLQGRSGFEFRPWDVTQRDQMAELFEAQAFDAVVNLAAQAGVRAAASNPRAYAQTNLVGFLNVLEGCRHSGVRHLVYASSSSVYGANTTLPYSEHHPVDHPVSLYAATKRANELMAHSYSDGYGVPTTGLRLFTVYGPWGRPDMAPHRFLEALLAGRPVPVFHQGTARRDFTYIDDVVEAMVRVIPRPPHPCPAVDGRRPDPARSAAPFRLLNVGHSRSLPLSALVDALAVAVGQPAQSVWQTAQVGDVPATWADATELVALTGFRPGIELSEGVRRFVAWYQDYYAMPSRSSARHTAPTQSGKLGQGLLHGFEGFGLDLPDALG
jgi:UDP-glucuronate 4-epimerase